jgi:DHA1 family bicyclomycin/chloramphenicol resistance-like MFS transporter
MTDVDAQARLGRGELVALTALLMSLVAMSIDAMLPALGEIGADLQVAAANDAQLVVSSMFLGLAVAQLGFGPLSDGIGRKPAIHAALLIFLGGCLLSMLATSFAMMLAGRVLQGIGAAGPRVIAVAVVRDQYEGRGMARIMSTAMAVFIIVPTLAPAVGQGVMAIAHWRVIFAVLLVQGIVALAWFGLRQPETLPVGRRQSLSPRRLGRAIGETLCNRIALGYTLAASLVSGAFIGYLSSAPQIFQIQYRVGALFPLYFGSLALSLGIAALINSRLVERLGMRHLCWRALLALAGLSIAFAAIVLAAAGHPPLWALMAYLVPAFFSIGILFGNFNALAMEPLGHIAGTAASVIGSLSTIIALIFGVVIGQAFDGTVRPLVLGFAVLATASIAVMAWTERGAGARD